MPDEWISGTEAARILDVTEGALHARKKNGALSYRNVPNPEGPGLQGQYMRSEILTMREVDKVTAAYAPYVLHALGALIGLGGTVEDSKGRATSLIRGKMRESYSGGTVASGLAVLEADGIVKRQLNGKRTYLIELTEAGREFVRDNLAGLDPFMPKAEPRKRMSAEDRHMAEVQAAAEAGYVAANVMDKTGTPGATAVVVTRVPVTPDEETANGVAKLRALVDEGIEPEDVSIEEAVELAEAEGLIEPAPEPEPQPDPTEPKPGEVPFPEPEQVRYVPAPVNGTAVSPPLPGLGTPLVVFGLQLDDDGQGINLVLRNGVRSWTVRVVGTVSL